MSALIALQVNHAISLNFFVGRCFVNADFFLMIMQGSKESNYN
jgi:hypothetical protein